MLSGNQKSCQSSPVGDFRFGLVGMAREIALWWSAIEGQVDAALKHSGFQRYSADDVYARLLNGRMQLWIGADDDGPKVIVVTETSNYPQRRTFGIVVCTGEDREDWLHHLGTIEEWGRGEGCHSAVLFAREGWTRVLKPLGYDKTHVILEKAL